MQIQIQPWGNSLGMRIPKPFKDVLNLKPGSKVELKIIDNQLIVTPLSIESLNQNVDLKELTTLINSSNQPSQLNDEPVGKEIW